MNKPNYKWFESWWFLILLILLSAPTYGLSLFAFGIIALVRARKLYLHQKSLKLKTEITKPGSDQTVKVPPLKPNDNLVNQDYLNYSRIRKLVSDYTVIDFETTGLNPDEHEIIQLAAVKYRNHEKASEYYTYIQPIDDIPARITRINGITNEDVENAPYIQEALPKLLEFIGDDVLVAHNATFDMNFLLTKIRDCKFEYQKFRVADTLSLARKHIHETDNHKLVTLKKFLKLNQLKSHDALHDCYVAGELYKYCFLQSLVKQ